MNFDLELNPKQYEAVTSTFKYNRIIAGAGSGKTRVLTYRLAYLIENRNIDPYNLLAITFTNKVAKEMKERTKDLLPSYDLKDLKISTFHSFCNYFLRREIKVLNLPRSFSILDEEDKENLIKDIGIDMGYRKGDDIIDRAKKFIDYHKMQGELPGDVEIDKLASKYKPCYEFFKEYEKRKNAQYSLDFDDLMIYTVLILKSYPEIKEQYNNRFNEILVDEFQDTNNLQFELLTLLAGNHAGIYVVGDPDQTIYTWRGANQRVILDVGEYFKPLNTIILNENYRSTEEILTHANTLIAKNIERVKKDLFTSNKGGEKIIVNESSDEKEEAKYVVKKITELKLIKKVNFKNIAILYRSAFSSREFERQLVFSHIPYKIFSGVKFYERKEVKDCLAYFKLLINPLDDISFSRIINIPRRGIGDATIAMIKKEAQDRNLSLYNYCLKIDEYMCPISSRLVSKIKDMINLLEETKNKVTDKNLSYSEVLSDLVSDLNYYEYLEENFDDDEERIGNVHSLIEDVRSFLKENPDSTFDEYLQNITLLTQQDSINDNDDVVSLMTVHTAKGLEFDYVFIVNFAEGIFPNARSVSENGMKALEEERRLAYVAITRAKKELFITYNTGFSYMNHGNSRASQFLNEANLSIKKIIAESPRKTDATGRIYKINIAGSGSNNVRETRVNRNESVVSYDVGNNIKWNVGDTAIHEAFGEGKVLKIEGDILTVDFKNFGIKKMLGTHKKMKKKE